MSDTPRTDRYVSQAREREEDHLRRMPPDRQSWCNGFYAGIVFARKLEIELQAMTRQLDEAQEELAKQEKETQ